jgi:predicted DCC family thiol-disulfide oxidoreductase YuxK
MQTERGTLKKPIVLFDGVCNLCNSSVQWIIKHDKKACFRFASLQSETGLSLLKEFNLPTDSLYSIILIEDGQSYERSDAIIRINCLLGGIWKISRIFLLIPISLRNRLYDFVAKRRYAWFGKKESCMIPTKELADRFL